MAIIKKLKDNNGNTIYPMTDVAGIQYNIFNDGSLETGIIPLKNLLKFIHIITPSGPYEGTLSCTLSDQLEYLYCYYPKPASGTQSIDTTLTLYLNEENKIFNIENGSVPIEKVFVLKLNWNTMKAKIITINS